MQERIVSTIMALRQARIAPIAQSKEAALLRRRAALWGWAAMTGLVSCPIGIATALASSESLGFMLLVGGFGVFASTLWFHINADGSANEILAKGEEERAKATLRQHGSAEVLLLLRDSEELTLRERRWLRQVLDERFPGWSIAPLALESNVLPSSHARDCELLARPVN